MSDQGTWEVDRIVGVRTRKGKRQYLIKWLGFEDDQNTWEPESNVNADLLESYHAEFSVSKAPKRSISKSRKRLSSASAKDVAGTKVDTSRLSFRKSMESIEAADEPDEQQTLANDNDNADSQSDKTADGPPGGSNYEFIVEQVVDHQRDPVDNQIYYLVKWEGYPNDQNTWEPECNIQDLQCFQEYKQAMKPVSVSESSSRPASSKSMEPRIEVNMVDASLSASVDAVSDEDDDTDKEESILVERSVSPAVVVPAAVTPLKSVVKKSKAVKKQKIATSKMISIEESETVKPTKRSAVENSSTTENVPAAAATPEPSNKRRRTLGTPVKDSRPYVFDSPSYSPGLSELRSRVQNALRRIRLAAARIVGH